MITESRKQWVYIILEIILFIITTGLLSYFSGKQEWKDFFYCLVIALILFMFLKYRENQFNLNKAKYFDDYLKEITNSAIQCGLLKFYNMQNIDEQDKRNRDCREVIDKAENMYLCANSGASYLDSSISRHWSNIEKKLNNGKNFKVVLLDPFSKNKKQRNKLNIQGDSYDSKLDIANLINLSNKYQNLEIKFIKNGMYSTIFSTNDELFFDPYHIGVIGSKIESKTFCLKFSRTENERDLYTIFKAHFEVLWKESINLKSWLAKNEKKYTNLPKLN